MFSYFFNARLTCREGSFDNEGALKYEVWHCRNEAMTANLIPTILYIQTTLIPQQWFQKFPKVEVQNLAWIAARVLRGLMSDPFKFRATTNIRSKRHTKPTNIHTLSSFTCVVNYNYYKSNYIIVLFQSVVAWALRQIVNHLINIIWIIDHCSNKTISDLNTKGNRLINQQQWKPIILTAV